MSRLLTTHCSSNSICSHIISHFVSLSHIEQMQNVLHKLACPTLSKYMSCIIYKQLEILFQLFYFAFHSKYIFHMKIQRHSTVCFPLRFTVYVLLLSLSLGPGGLLELAVKAGSGKSICAIVG